MFAAREYASSTASGGSFLSSSCDTSPLRLAT